MRDFSDRGREARKAEMLVEDEVTRFQRRIQALDAVPMIVALQDRVEQIRHGELERLRGKLGILTPKQQFAIENLTRSIVNKILHPPLSALKAAGGSDRLTTTAEVLRALFGIEEAFGETQESVDSCGDTEELRCRGRQIASTRDGEAA